MRASITLTLMKPGSMFVVVASLVAGCGTPSLEPQEAVSIRVVVGFSTEGLRVEGGVVSGCSGVEGRVFEEALEERLPLSFDDATPLSLEGEGGLVVRLINGDCEVVAFACLPFQGDEVGDLEIRVEAVAPLGLCAAGERCEGGECVVAPGEDAGPPLPEGVTRSPDGEGYCLPTEGYTCNCTGLTYYCENLDCTGSDRESICDAHPSEFRPILDEHGCPAFELVPSIELCNPPRPGVTLSPDGEGFCYPLEGYTCDCTPLVYFSQQPVDPEDGVCGAHPSDFVEIVDEHGCPGFEIVEMGESCPGE